MGKLFADLKTNLLMGWRLLSFRPCLASQFVHVPDQLAMLVLVDLLLRLVGSYLISLPNPTFDSYALPVFCLDILLAFLLTYVVARLSGHRQAFLPLNIIGLAASPLLTVLTLVDEAWRPTVDVNSTVYVLWGIFLFVYALLVIGRGYYLALEGAKKWAALLLAVTFMVGLLQFRVFGDAQNFWYVDDSQEEASDKWAEYRAIDAEALFYNQPALLAESWRSLRPYPQKTGGLYFVGFASYATEDVFLKEVTFAKNLMDSRFGTEGHSVNLVNHLATREQLPLASTSNLAQTLKHIGQLMQKEDVLMLYLTSHGSDDPQLAVDFWPLPLNALDPEKLRKMLDEAGIRWRMILISACYSGGFVKALANDQTLVATASSADRTSFGCGTQSEFTYFGEAVFKDQLTRSFAFLPALEKARVAIGERELREHIQPSQPQLSVGKHIAAKLEALAAQLRNQQCQAKPKDGAC